MTYYVEKLGAFSAPNSSVLPDGDIKILDKFALKRIEEFTIFPVNEAYISSGDFDEFLVVYIDVPEWWGNDVICLKVLEKAGQ